MSISRAIALPAIAVLAATMMAGCGDTKDSPASTPTMTEDAMMSDDAMATEDAMMSESPSEDAMMSDDDKMSEDAMMSESPSATAAG